MSIPFQGKQFTFTQPDGSQLEVIGWGNQHAAIFETLDGYTVVQDPATGFYEYAVPTEEGDHLRPSGVTPNDFGAKLLGLREGVRPSCEAARESARESHGLPPGNTRWERRLANQRARYMASGVPGIAMAPPQRQTVGDYVGLVLLIEFPDVPGTIDKREVEDYCNKKGYTGFGNQGSVYDYFFDVSGGLLRYTNIVTPYYRARNKRSYYTSETIPQPIRARELIREALRYWRKQGFDFSKLTTDDQDCVYAVNVFYAGPAVNNWAKGLWPHCYHLGTKFELAPNRFAHDYQVTNMGHELTLGTFCHENGHMICDFPDLYDYGNQSNGVGVYCLMCAGNIDPKNPTHVGAYLKYRAGWGTPQTVSQGAHTLRAGRNKFLIHRKSATEYFILENRMRAARDASLTSEGLAIWHVDELASNEHEQRTPTHHYECSLIQADGLFELEKKGNLGNAADLFGSAVVKFSDTTVPRSQWWDGSSSGLILDRISTPGPTITFEVK